MPDDITAAVQGKHGRGTPLDTRMRGRMEVALGAGLGPVSIHTDSQADTLNRRLKARAFTSGRDIFFRQGEYNPGSTGGRNLLAHELTHVHQQRRSSGPSKIRRRIIRQEFSTAGRETGPVWDAVLVITGAPAGDSYELQDFIGACHDGITSAAQTLGSASGISTRRMRVRIRYRRGMLLSAVSQEAYRLALRSVLGDPSPPEPVPSPGPEPAPVPEPSPTPAPAPPSPAPTTPSSPETPTVRESLRDRAEREAGEGSPQLRDALERSIMGGLDFTLSTSNMDGATRISVGQGGGINVVVMANFTGSGSAPAGSTFVIELMQDILGRDTSHGQVSFTAGTRGTHRWSSLPEGSYYFRISKTLSQTLSGTIWVDVLSGPGERARPGEAEDQFEVTTGIDTRRHDVSAMARGQYALRSEPVPNSFIFGTLPGRPTRVRVIDKRSFDRAGTNSWYKIAFQNRADFERVAVEVPSETSPSAVAREMYNAGHAWVTADALKVYVPYNLLMNQIRAFEAQPSVSSLSLRERVTLLRQLHADPDLPFDEVIGTQPGTRTVEDRPELSNLIQLLKGPVTGIVLPGGEFIDFAHFIITLDAYGHPDRMVMYTPGYGIPGLLNIGSSRAIASWSGDVGGAVGDYTVDHEDRSLAAMDTALLNRHFEKSAPDADLLGNLDGLGAHLLLQQDSSISSIEQLTRLYYEGVSSARPQGDPNALRTNRAQAITTFLSSYGFTNPANLRSSTGSVACLLTEAFRFSLIWYLKRRGVSLAWTPPPLSLLMQVSGEMVSRFLNRMQAFAATYGVTTIPAGLTRSVACPAPPATGGGLGGGGSSESSEEQPAEVQRKIESPSGRSNMPPPTISIRPPDIQLEEGGELPELRSVLFRRSPRLMRAYQRGTVDISRTTGSRGSVTMIQQALIYLEYTPGNPDGDFGDGTEAAVMTFQRRMGITSPSGRVDQGTLRELDAHVADREAASPDSATSSAGVKETKFSDYPQTHIRQVYVDLGSQNVDLDWTGPTAASRDTGPFHCSTGRGILDDGTCNDCDDTTVSNNSGTNCTPKGTHTVTSIADSLPSYPEAMFVTYFVPSRAIAFHYYPSVPDHPASHGCVRLHLYPAILIHDNVVPRTTQVEVGGTWTRYWMDRIGCTMRGVEQGAREAWEPVEGLTESASELLESGRSAVEGIWNRVFGEDEGADQ